MMIDLNADMGEGYGIWNSGDDASLMPVISSANIACGLHAGDPKIMLRTVEMALRNRVAVGAHPGFADIAGFGRRRAPFLLDEVGSLIAYQVGALVGVAAQCGAVVKHVKPHGELYNIAEEDPIVAALIAEAVMRVNPELTLVGLAGGLLVASAAHFRLKTKREAFADRLYGANGKLISRLYAGALITDPQQAARQALSIVRDHTVTAMTGERVDVTADTICIHSDTPGSVAVAKAVRQALEEAGFAISAEAMR